MHLRAPRVLGLLAVLALLAASFVVLRARVLPSDDQGTASLADVTSAESGAVPAQPPGQGIPSATAPAPSAVASPSAAAATAKAAAARAAAAKAAAAQAAARATAAAKSRATAQQASSGAGSSSSPRRSSVKKGASVWAGSGLKASLADSGVSWYYTWAASHPGISAPAGVQFVPMIWGRDSVTAANLAAAKRSGGAKGTLLGFNEPDLGEQSNMSVDEALTLWPKLQATGMRLASPAVAWGADQKGQWLDRFMSGAKAKGYRVDVITLHWYGSDFSTPNAVKQLKAYVAATYAKYRKPIWVTEYALMNFGGGAKYPPESNQAAFVRASTAMLQKLPYVERYAWFAFPTSTDGSEGTGLYWPGGRATPMGKAYRAAG